MFDLTGRKLIPIPFVPELVLEIIAGNKTETRRLVRGQDEFDELQFTGYNELIGIKKDKSSFNRVSVAGYTKLIKKPYYPGDILYVKENWAAGCFFDDRPPRLIWDTGRYLSPPPVWYRADGLCSLPDGLLNLNDNVIATRGKWRSSMFMCKWMARLFLEVEASWHERLHDITPQGAVAEGFPSSPSTDMWNDYATGSATVDLFAEKWDKINKKRGFPWKMNPWVVAVKFKVVPVEIGELLAWRNSNC